MKRLLILLLLLLPALTQAQTVITPVAGVATVDMSTCPSAGASISCAFQITMTGNATLNLINGRGSVDLFFTNTGAFTLTWPGTVVSPPTVASSTTTLVSLKFNSTLGQWYVTSGGSSSPFTSPGTFDNTKMSNPFIFSTPTCPIATIFQSVQFGGTTFGADGLAGCIDLPTSGVTNGYSSGVAGYIRNNNPNSTGFYGKVSGVGVAGTALCGANTTACWGMNAAAADGASLTGVQLIGIEAANEINNVATTGEAFLASSSFNVQPAVYPAFLVNPPALTGKFTAGFHCATNSLNAGDGAAFPCVELDGQITGVSNSQSILLNANNGSPISGFINYHKGSYVQLAFPALTIINPTTGGVGGPEAFGIAFKATAGLAVNTLVKIDTANADSVVICTTVDTNCDGFVMDQLAATNNCTAGNANCAIATVSGIKAQGILGTGTCTIGQFVVVDTTTNGRVKCQAGIPAQGTYIGKALSAQAVVGSLVDVLTKFQ